MWVDPVAFVWPRLWKQARTRPEPSRSLCPPASVVGHRKGHETIGEVASFFDDSEELPVSGTDRAKPPPPKKKTPRGTPRINLCRSSPCRPKRRSNQRIVAEFPWNVRGAVGSYDTESGRYTSIPRTRTAHMLRDWDREFVPQCDPSWSAFSLTTWAGGFGHENPHPYPETGSWCWFAAQATGTKRALDQ